MKKDKLKKIVKAARKTARKNIKLSLIAGLKEITGKFGQDSKKLEKEIEKGSKYLAKKLSKEIKIDKPEILKSVTPSSKTSKPVGVEPKMETEMPKV